MEPTFEDVLEGARRGDTDALATLWRSLNHRLERFLWVQAGDAACDIAAETWLSAMRTLGRFVGGEVEFRAWLFTIARRRLVDWQRREARLRNDLQNPDLLPPIVAADDTEDDALGRMSTAGAMELLASLPIDQAEVISLRILADLDVERVAVMLGKRSGNVRVLQHRGLRHLRALLQQSEQTERGVTT
jgi:RNA polymerase sigma-70 factor (ECF subfamily)